MKLPEKLKFYVGREEQIVVINQIIDYLEEKQWQFDNEYARGYNDGAYEQRTTPQTDHVGKANEMVIIPKPEWWSTPMYRIGYEEALEAASKALGVSIKLED